jgi:hypothetical protein
MVPRRLVVAARTIFAPAARYFRAAPSGCEPGAGGFGFAPASARAAQPFGSSGPTASVGDLRAVLLAPAV